LTLVWLVKPYAFTSLWCLYAAMISGLLYFYFVERRIAFLETIRETEHDFSEKLTQELNRLEQRFPVWRERFLQKYR
ncbi:MAG: hypothetical protein DSY80_01195, partial [Desulfocapsa sp.]